MDQRTMEEHTCIKGCKPDGHLASPRSEQIEDGYAVPTDMKVWAATITGEEVVVVDLTVIIPGQDLDPQRALLVFTKSDAIDLAASINSAAAGEEQ